MGVPINFLSKYNPDQFEIVGASVDSKNTLCHIQKDYTKLGYKFFKQDGSVSGSGALRDKMSPKIPVKGKSDYSLAPDGSVLSATYSRIFIRKKHKKTKRYRVKVRNIVMGVPINFLSKYNPDQFEIVSFRKGDNGEDLIFTRERENEFNRTFESLYNIDSRNDQEQGRVDKWETYIRENNNKKGGLIREPIDCFHKNLKDIKGYDRGYVNKKRMYDRIFIRKKHKKTKRYRVKVHNIVMGVPITFLDKYCPKQFEIVGLDRYVEDNPNFGHRFHLNKKEVYARILIKHVIK